MRLLVLCAAALLAAVAPARADHHLQKRALQEARCLPRSVDEISRSNDNVAYLVICSDASARRLVLVCTPSRCLADPHGEHDDGEDEP